MTTLYSGRNIVNYDIGNKRGEYIDFTFPLSIKPVNYSIWFSEDSFPVVWYIFGKLKNSNWILMSTENNIQTFSSLKPSFTPYGNNVTYQITTPIPVDTIRLHVSVSTGPSTKIRELVIIDEKGQHIPFLIPFCTNTNSLYHSGSLNFSRLDKFSINANLPTDFYAVAHDSIQIENGMLSTDPLR